MDERVRDELVRQFKSIQRYCPMPESEWVRRAPLVVQYFGQGRAYTARDFLACIEIEDEEQAIKVDAALVALGLSAYTGPLQTRLENYGLAQASPVKYFQARNWAEEGYRILADRVLDPTYALWVEVAFIVSSKVPGSVDVSVHLNMRDARQETRLRVSGPAGDGTERQEMVRVPLGRPCREVVVFNGLSIATEPQVNVEWPSNFETRIWSDIQDVGTSVMFVKAHHTAGVWVRRN